MRISKAIKIAIRTYFGNAAGFEFEIYNRLCETNEDAVMDIDFSDIGPDIYVSTFVEDFDVDQLQAAVGQLVNNIVAEFSGE